MKNEHKDDCKKVGFVFEVMMEIKNNKYHKRELLKILKENKCK